MKRTITTLSAVCAIMLGAAAPASALECAGLTIPDALAVELVNSQVAGERFEISDRKSLEIHQMESITGSECSFRAVVDVTLHRKIRRDASGTVVLKGDLRLEDGKICVANASVADVDVSNTLNLGESIYKWVANRALPSTLCF